MTVRMRVGVCKQAISVSRSAPQTPTVGREVIARGAMACVNGLRNATHAPLTALFQWDADVKAMIPLAVSGGEHDNPEDEMFTVLRDVALRAVSAALEDPGTAGEDGLRVSRRGISVVAIPVVAQGSVGVLGVADQADRVFSPDAIGAVRAFGEMAAPIFENAALHRELGGLEASQRRVVESERLHAIGELAAGVAHHLNNIMTVIVGHVDLVLRRTPADEGASLRSIRRAVLEGAELVRRLGSFSRTQPARDQTLLDMNDLAADVIEVARARWQDEAQMQGITIEATVERRAALKVIGDPVALREALLNIVLNAVDALPTGGRIVLKTWDDGAHVHCSVADDGVGMPGDVRTRALEPFFTTKGLKSRGLGLSVAFGNVQQHGGTLMIDSIEDRGTTVTMSLPVRSARVAFRTGQTAADNPDRPLRILLVDDDAAVRFTLVQLLTDDGHTVVEAGTAADALRHLDEEPDFDIVFTDLGMPRMNGWELTNAIKRVRPALRVVLITGWGETPQGGRQDWLGPDGVLAKPITEDALRDVLVNLQTAGAR